MMRVLVVCLLPMACASAPTAAPLSSNEQKAQPTPPAMCPEPTSLVAATTTDPPAPNEWRRSAPDSLAIDDGPRRYTMTPEGAIAANDWSVPERKVAGGAFGLMLSPAGGVVGRQYSRGGLELFDAKNGKLLREVGAAVPSPNDAFVLDVPHIPFALDAWNHDDVKLVPMDPKLPVRSIVKLPLKNESSNDFGAAVCANGGLIAISFPTTELAIYRASDLQKLATVANPGPGAPVFTRSGRFVAVGTKTFALKP